MKTISELFPNLEQPAPSSMGQLPPKKRGIGTSLSSMRERKEDHEKVTEELDRRGVPYYDKTTGVPFTLWERLQLYVADAPAWDKKRAIVFTPQTIEPLIDDGDSGEGEIGGFSRVSTQKPVYTPPKPVPQSIVLSDDQEEAFAKILLWLGSNDPFFVLRGYAGTGKTFLMKKLLDLTGHRFQFTAPTNKAADVLTQTLGYPARTIHSFLGLRMEQDEDKVKLTYPMDAPILSRGTIVVVDEASMVGSELHKFIQMAQVQNRIRIMYVGDPMQLNPVGEARSPAWECVQEDRNKAKLTEIMRFDNQLLNLSARIRRYIKKGIWRSPIKDDHDDKEGVYLLEYLDYKKELFSHANVDYFVKSKVVCWRNKMVNKYNERIRANLGFTHEYEEGECLMIASPVKQGQDILANIDDEGRVLNVSERTVRIHNGPEVKCSVLHMKMREDNLTLNIPLGNSIILDDWLQRKAANAKSAKGLLRKQLWKEFWEVKDQFHSVRYSYALTAHRIQGTTLTNVYVDQEDILSNRNKEEAFHALYVAATRPTTQLFTY